MTEELLNKRIGWAYNALEWSYHYKSDWGIEYWSEVIRKLLEMKPEVTYH